MRTRRQLLDNLGTTVLVVCAVIVTGFVVRHELSRSTTERRELREPHLVNGWDSRLGAASWEGSTAAPLVIVEVADPFCRYCRDAYHDLEAMRAEYGERIAIAHLQFPRDEGAMRAAMALECAGRQGSYRRYQALLHSRLSLLRREAWDSLLALSQASDPATFAECLASAWPQRRIDEQLAAVRSLGVSVTPTLLVNGLIIEGRQPLELLVALADSILGAGSAGGDTES